MSLIEKYPDEYGITLVGVEVTRMNAMLDVIPAGTARTVGSSLSCVASAIMSGTMMVPVTVLLDRSTLMSATPRTTRKTCHTSGTEAIRPKASVAIHLAAPVVYSVMPRARPVATRITPPQAIWDSIFFHDITLIQGRNRSAAQPIATNEM